MNTQVDNVRPLHTLSVSEMIELLERTNDSSERLPLLDSLSLRLSRDNQNEAWKYAREEQALAMSLQDQHWMVKSYLRLGDCAFAAGKYAESEKYIKKALKLAEGFSESYQERATIFSRLGRTLFSMGESKEALAALEQSLLLRSYIEDKRDRGATAAMAGSIFGKMGMLDRSVELFEEAFSLFKEVSHHRGEAMVLLDIGLIHQWMENLDVAHAYFQECQTAASQLGLAHLEAEATLQLANVAYRTDDYQGAIPFYMKAKDLFHHLGDQLQYGQTLIKLAEIYRLLVFHRDSITG